MQFRAIRGTVITIEDMWSDDRQNSGCNKVVNMIADSGQPVSFILTPRTYVVHQDVIRVGTTITGWLDANAPVPLIFPPRYEALIMARSQRGETVVVDYFNDDLVNPDNDLRLNIGPRTEVILMNNQPFSGVLGNRELIVTFGAATMSIPAQTTPSQVVVIC